ncbi:MAG: hypothetical protein ACI8TF_002581, partial [Paracoccaceae bacterium]
VTLSCGLQILKQAGNLRVEGFIDPDQPVSGSYLLAVERSGRSGTSIVNQGWAFSTDGRDLELLGQVILNAQPREIVGELTLNWDGGQQVCRNITLRDL